MPTTVWTGPTTTTAAPTNVTVTTPTVYSKPQTTPMPVTKKAAEEVVWTPKAGD